MSLTSLAFFGFFLGTLILYYLIPVKFRYLVLLAASVAFFLLSSTPYTGLYLLADILVTALCARGMTEEAPAGRKKGLLAVGLVVNLGILAVLKYSHFFADNLAALVNLFGANLSFELPELLSPLGISFYTLTAVGYLLDCYWGLVEPEKNPLKTALFISYYPALTSGPIMKWREMKDQLFTEHRFSYENLTGGLQRMLWGLFKKLVLSVRLATVVNTVYGDLETYQGLYVWVAAGLFMLQLYTDFSGCMDIILGAGECYGIRAPENFRQPFFSRSVQEFWQRWHITLGGWLKEYILYPVLRSRLFSKMTKAIKNKFGRKASRQIPSYLGMLIVWLAVGLWHGGDWKYVLGMGLWYFMLIALSSALTPVFKKVNAFLHVKEDSFSWHLFQSLRVFLLVSFGNVFFRLDSVAETFTAYKAMFSTFNPWIFFNGGLLNLGLTNWDLNVLTFGLLLLLAVSCLAEKYGTARAWLKEQGVVFRYFVWLSLLLLVVIFGAYGPGFDATDFIYKGF